MNCKPGDLAVIVKSEGYGIAGQVSRFLVGKIVKVMYLKAPESDLYCYANQVWHFEEPIKVEVQDKVFIANGIADFCLRPIRPDETPEQSIEAMKLLHQLPKETV